MQKLHLGGITMLPENKPKIPDLTPKNYFIWGETMAGKTYLSCQLPNPIILNTDGNAAKIETPSIEIKDINTLTKTLDELEKTTHSFETVIIDLVDDVLNMIKRHVCVKNNVSYEGDVGYGKGYAEVKSLFTQFTLKLRQLNMNVVYISHYIEKLENGQTIPMASLPIQYINIVNGACDLSIQCRKLGKKYIAITEKRRSAYQKENIKNKHILKVLENIVGVFDENKIENKGDMK